MKNTEEKWTGYYEQLIQNARKGESYRITLKGNPVTYLAIPYIKNVSEDIRRQKFIMKVLKPDIHKGMQQELLTDIEILEEHH